MQNGVKNGQNTQFSSDNQPSGEAKSQGWQRKRLAREFMDRIFEMQEMSIKQFEAMESKMEKSKTKYTMRDLMARNYIRKMVNSDKLLLDWLDRHIGKPPKFDEREEQADTFPRKVAIHIMNKHRTWDEDGNIIEVDTDADNLN